MSEEIELQLRLDQDGRTSRPPSNDDDNVNSTDHIDYNSKTTLTNLASYDDETLEKNDEMRKRLDDLLLDCEIADSGLLPRTFWMPAQGVKPRCVLEQCALEVFQKHVPKDYVYDSNTSGAEWWVQIRPSPTTGRYAMHATDKSDGEEDMAKTGISFHWDKDEDLRLLMGGSMYIHPHISTVTYITSLGSPTMALNIRIHPMNGEWIVPHQECGNLAKKQPSEKIDSGNSNTPTYSNSSNDISNRDRSTKESIHAYISWPQRGKHLSFDGRYLHAAPGDFMEHGEFEKQIQFNTSSDNKLNRLMQRQHRRVTFLVNIWLNYKPFNVNMFPDTMIDKLTKVDSTVDCILFHDPYKHYDQKINNECDTIDITIDKDTNIDDLKTHTWPLGDYDSGEKITVAVPIKQIQTPRGNGGNYRVCWDSTEHSTFVTLFKETIEKAESSTNGETSKENTKNGETIKTQYTDNREDCQKKSKHQRLE